MDWWNKHIPAHPVFFFASAFFFAELLFTYQQLTAEKARVALLESDAALGKQCLPVLRECVRVAKEMCQSD